MTHPSPRTSALVAGIAYLVMTVAALAATFDPATVADLADAGAAA